MSSAALAQVPTRPLSDDVQRRDSVIARGLSYTTLTATGSGDPWSAHLLSVDLATNRLDLALALEQIVGQETTSSVVKRRGALAGVNGGFSVSNDAWNIIHGDPNGFLVVDGRVVSEPYPGRPALGICDTDERQEVRVVRPILEIVVDPGGWLVGLNRSRGEDDIVLYTPDWGRSTITGSGGIDVVARGGVVRDISRSGSVRIPDDGFVLSAEGSWMDSLSTRFTVGSVVEYRLDVTDAGGTAIDIAGCDFTGAGPLIAVNDAVRHDFEGEAYPDAFVFSRHPRTAVGVSSDGRTAFLFVIDGRQEHSAGATLEELATLLVAEGAHTVYNLDGGGSTTMALAGGVVVNSPSDGPERRRCDVLLVVPRG